MPKAITIPPHDEGVEGNLKHFVEQLQWATNFDIRKQMLQGLKEIGSIIFWMSLLDTAMRETETVRFMQVVPWLGVVPNKAGQLQQLLCDDNFSPLVSLFKNATNEILKNPDCLNSKAFVSMSKQAEVADILYMNNLQTGSVLDYTLKFLVAVLVRSRERWDFPSKSGLIEITVSKEYHRIYSAIQFMNMQGIPPSLQSLLFVHSTNSVEADSFLEQYGDAVAWGGCTILYLLGQQLRFELLDFTYHVLAVAEAEALLLSTASLAEKSKSGHHTLEVAAFLENGKKARRLNSHVFSLLRAQSPHMDKLASMIKQNGTVLQHFKLPVTPSLLTRLALRGKSHNKKTWQYFSCASYTHVPKILKISSFNSF
jgi:cytoplasmic FMR1 interacting protein